MAPQPALVEQGSLSPPDACGLGSSQITKWELLAGEVSGQQREATGLKHLHGVLLWTC